MRKKAAICFIFFFTLLSLTHRLQAQDNPKFRFAVTGCFHLHSITDLKVLDVITGIIGETKPDFIITLGGMLDSYDESETSAQNLCNKYDESIKNFGIPVYDVPSNCLLFPDWLDQETPKALIDHYFKKYKSRNYSIEHKKCLFLFADPDNDPLQGLQEKLTDTSLYDHVFLSLSRLPKINIGTQPVDNSLNTLFTSGRLSTVFHSTMHTFDIQKVNSTDVVAAGSPLGSMPNLCALTKQLLPHIVIVDVFKDRISYTLIPIIYPESSPPYTDMIKLPVYAGNRIKILPPDRIIQALKIREGMEIVDIGAGAGIYTFAIADKLNGSGHVFATEADMSMIQYLEEKRSKENYKNVSAVFVNPIGVDEFYKSRIFDIIFVSETYTGIIHPEKYFRDIRSSLRKKTGRLFIITFGTAPDFMDIEFGDFKKTIALFRNLGKRSPLRNGWTRIPAIS